MQQWAYEPTPVLYFFSVLFNKDLGSNLDIFNKLKNEFFQLKLVSDLYNPKNNPLLDYYAKQMGSNINNLQRFFCYSSQPLPRDLLVEIKVKAMNYEISHFNNHRMINIDPGYIAAEQLVLSSHKPYAHRLYVRQGVYVELEYLYKNNNWIELPWTYPDYIDQEKKNYFFGIRKLLL